ncbi:hypothetical protein DIPPA_14566 [Diplonema papillatum]|nr:hypothetical protein DIPPA_14566 [Diplonema papillatum]
MQGILFPILLGLRKQQRTRFYSIKNGGRENGTDAREEATSDLRVRIEAGNLTKGRTHRSAAEEADDPTEDNTTIAQAPRKQLSTRNR